MKKSLRYRNRYLVFKLLLKGQVKSIFQIENIFKKILINFMGEVEYNLGKIVILKNTFDPKTMCGILRCKHTHVDKVRCGLLRVHHIGDMECSVLVLGVSGTIKKAMKKFMVEKNGNYDS
jgi:RNase P/RNase MRP subunit POP5